MKNNRSASKKFTSRILFRAINILNFFNLEQPAFAAIYFVSEIFFIIPFVYRAYDYFEVPTFLGDFSKLLPSLISSLQDLASAYIPSLIFIAASFLHFLGLFAVGISVTLNSYKEGSYVSQTKPTIFRWLCYLTTVIRYPLTNYLSLLFMQNITKNTLLSLLTIIPFVLVCLVNFYLEEYFISIDFKDKFIFSKVAINRDGLRSVLKIVTNNLFLLFLPNQNLYSVLFVLIALIFTVLSLYEIIFFRKYYCELAESMFTIQVLITTSLLISTFMLEIFPIDLLTNNIVWLVITLSLFLAFTLFRFQQYRNNQIVSLNPAEIGNEKKAIIYIMELIKMSENIEYRQHFRPYFIIKHLRSCQDILCFCKESKTQSTLRLLANTQFMNSYMLHNISILQKQFSESVLILSLYFSFKIYIRPNCSNIRAELDNFIIKNENRNHMNSFIRYQLQNRIQKQISLRISKNGKMPFYKLFKEQELQLTLNEHLGKIVEYFGQKYKQLSIQIINLNIINQYCDKINQKMLLVQEIWSHFSQSDSYNIPLYLKFLLYFEKIIPCVEDARSVHFIIKSKIKQLLTLQGITTENIHIQMYSQKAFILESKFDENFGVISNASTSCQSLLGLPKKRLIGQHINNFMPQFFSKGHQKSIENWLKKESFTINNNQALKCLYVDAKFVGFSGSFYSNIYYDSKNLKFYGVFVRDNDEDFVVLSSQGTIEGIGLKISSLQVFSTDQLHKKITDFCSKIVFPQDFSSEIRQTIFIFSKSARINTKKSLQNLDELQQQKRIERGRIFECSVKITKYKLGDTFYYGIYFISINKAKFSNKNTLDLQANNLFLSQYPYSRTFTKEVSGEIQLGQQSRSLQNSMRSNNKIFNYIQNESSVHNSTLSQSINSNLNKTFYYVKQKFKNPQLMKNKSLLKLNLTIVCCSLLVIIGFFGLQQVFDKGIRAMNKTMYGNGEILDNIQTVEMIYNNMLMSNVYCSQQYTSPRCQHVLKYNTFTSHKLYSILVSNLQSFLTKTIQFTGMNYYATYNSRVIYYQNGTAIQMAARDFILKMYSLLLKTSTHITQSAANQAEIEENEQNMQIVFDNWAQLKTMNQASLSFYSEAEYGQIIHLIQYLLSVFIGIVLLMLFFSFYINQCFDSRQKNKFQVLQIHQRINKKTVKTLLTYFLEINEVMKSEKFEIRYPQIDAEFFEEKVNIHYQKNKKVKYYILIIFMVVSLMLCVEVIKIVAMIPVSQNMIDIITRIQESQNRLMEGYYELKTYYIDYNFGKSSAQMSSELMDRLNQTEVQFNSIIKQSISLFSKLDKNFTSDFNQLVTSNICHFSGLNAWQAKYCENGTHYPILQKGLAVTTEFLQRFTIQAIIQLQSDQITNKTKYFTQDIYQDLDDYIFYMYYLWDPVQMRMYQALIYGLEQVNSSLGYINYGTIFVFLVLMVLWLGIAGKEQTEESYLYGYVIQIPYQILARKNYINQLKQVIELQQ